MAVFVNESRYDLQVTISDCFYEDNYARSFGGSVYLLLGGFGTHHTIVMESSMLKSNVARLGGGGVQASFFNNGPEEDPLLMRFNECVFEGNTGIAGGGLFVFTSTDGELCLLKMNIFCLRLCSKLWLMVGISEGVCVCVCVWLGFLTFCLSLSLSLSFSFSL